MDLSQRSIDKLQKRLPRGYTGKVHKKLRGRFSRPYIAMVATGKRNNSDVMATLISVAEENHRQQVEIAGRIDRIK